MIRRIIATKEEEIRTIRGMRHGPRRKPLIPVDLSESVNIIAELKRKSPSAGAIGEVDDRRLAAYSQYAKAVSVLTDQTYFGGSFTFLEEVALKVPLPILCKDFIIDESQIDLAYARGADIVLLIVRILGKERLSALYKHARTFGLECLVEIHEKAELKEISGITPRLVGVNARNLDNLEIDLAGAAKILGSVNAPIRVAESGIRSRADMERFTGANTFLVGEILMRSGDPEAVFRELLYG
jgi:indole-3-glycerol phosphate synthase